MKKLFAILTACAMCASCGDMLEEVSFEVIPDAGNVYETGQELLFRFRGNPDHITFYSDEPGFRYAYAGRVDEEGTANFGVAVKSMSARQESFSYVYRTPGEYEIVFVGSNATCEGESSRAVSFHVTISEPDEAE